MKETILSAIRALLVAAGAFLIGKHFFAQEITSDWVTLIAGGVIAAVGFIWSVITKQVGTDAIFAAVKSAIAFIGGIIISAGIIDEQSWIQISGVLVAILSVVSSLVLKKQNENIANGVTNIQKLSRLRRK